MCLYLTGRLISASSSTWSLTHAQWRFQGAGGYSVPPPEANTSVFYSVQGPDKIYFPNVSPDTDDQWVAYMQYADYRQVSTDFLVSPSNFRKTAMLATKKGSLESRSSPIFLMSGWSRFLPCLGIQRIPTCHTSHTWSVKICWNMSYLFLNHFCFGEHILPLLHQRGISSYAPLYIWGFKLFRCISLDYLAISGLS